MLEAFCVLKHASSHVPQAPGSHYGKTSHKYTGWAPPGCPLLERRLATAVGTSTGTALPTLQLMTSLHFVSSKTGQRFCVQGKRAASERLQNAALEREAETAVWFTEPAKGAVNGEIRQFPRRNVCPTYSGTWSEPGATRPYKRHEPCRAAL